MAILNIQIGEVGLTGVKPRVIYIDTNDTLATVVTAGYLNNAKQQGYAFSEYDMALVSTKTTPSSAITEVAWLEVSYSNPDWSLVPSNSPGEVVLPTVANRLAHFTNTTGTLSSDAANVVNAGNIAAGLSGTAGTISSFPATLARGSLVLAAVNNTGDTLVTISNAAHGQASVYSIPDGGQTTAEFIISDSAGTQNITSGNLSVNAGSLSSGLAAGGFAGSVIAYSTTASSGSLRLLAVNSAGDFAVTISNASHGQASVVSIPDGGQATSEFIIADSAGTQNITSGNLSVNAGSISSGLAAGGFAGSLILYSTTASNGSLRMLSVNNAGDFAVTVSNASHGQSSVVSIPDGGQATSEFIIADSAGTQNITSGNLSVNAGSLSSGLAAGGFAGSMIAYSTTASMGSLRLLAVNSAGDFAVTISNASHGQASVVSIPDGGQATSEFIIADSAGTQNITSGNLSVNAGSLSSGLAAGGFAGSVIAYSTTASNGSLRLLAVNNAGDFAVTISNASHGQDSVYNIPDVGQAIGSILVNVLDNADPAADIVTFDVTVTAAALATAGTVTLQASSGTKQYKIRELFLNSGGTNFSGGGGDRLATISDGTTSYSVIPAANLQALTNERWGTTAVPYPAAAAINTSTAAGVAVTIAYSGGAADYAAGSMVISGIAERVA